MKKILSIVFLMIFIQTSVFAVAKNSDLTIPTKEIAFLQENDVLVGDPNGDLRADDQITRAEFVTILCRAIGIEELAETDEMKTKVLYKDVPITHWAVGYINAATEYGAINGVGNGFFCPEMSVTNEQAIKILVAAWGYTDEAEKLGGYPNGYMAIAKQFGVTDSVLINYGLASRRWVVSVFTYNMLSVMPKEVELNLVATTKIEKVDEPIGENGTDYVKNPSKILEQITPETISYERKIFEQRVPEGETIPVELSGEIIKYVGNVDFDNSTISIGKTSEKECMQINLKQDCTIDISELDEDEYEIIVTTKKNNIIDTFYIDLIISEGTAMLGESFRITYLRHQPIIENTNTEIIIDKNSNYEIPFDIKVDIDNNDKVVMCLNYPEILNEGGIFEYDIVSAANETINEGIKGVNRIIEPILIDNLKLDEEYSVSIGISEQDRSHNVIKGKMIFKKIGSLSRVGVKNPE